MNVGEVIRRIILRSTTEGFPESEAALKKLSAAQDGVAKSAAATATVTDTASKSQLSLADAVAKAERRFNSTLRAQQDFEKIQRQMNLAVQQNPALQDRANAVIAQAAQHFNQAGISAKAFQAATSGVSGQLIALSAGAGPAGTFLAALGPWGLAAAVGLGVAEKAFSAISVAAHELAQKSQELRQFSEATGLTTQQVQALKSEFSKFGVTGDEAQTSITKFTSEFAKLRIGEGELLTQVRRVNPALADQMAHATNAASAMTLFGQALAQTSNIFERNRLSQAGAGRGGLRTATAFSGIDVDAVTKSYVDAGKALDDGLIKKLAQLEIDIQKTSSKARQNIASIFAQDVLQAQLSFTQKFLELSEAAKHFTLSEGLLKLLGANAGILSAIMNGRTSSGAASTDESGMVTGFNVPMPRSKPQELDPRFIANQLKDQIAAMGDAATAAQKLDLAQKQLAISGKDAGLTAGQLARASGILNETFANQRLQANTAALGSAATVTEQFTAKVSALQLQLDKGEISAATFKRAFDGLKNDEALHSLSATVSALGDLASPMEQYALKVAQLKQQLDQGRISQDTFNRAAFAALPIIKEFREATSDFAKTFAHGLIEGKSAVDALAPALTQLGTKLVDKAIDQTINAALSAIGSATGGLVGGATQSTALLAGSTSSAAILTAAGASVAAEMIAGATTAASILGLTIPAAASTLPPAGAAAGLGIKLGADAGALTLAAVIGPLVLLVAAVVAIGGSMFLSGQSQQQQQRQQRETQRLQDLHDARARADSLFDRRATAGLDTSTQGGSLVAFDVQANRQRADEAAKGGGAMVELEQTLALERLAIINKFTTDAAAAEEAARQDALKRQQSFQDRLFSATNDTSTLAGALAEFERQAQADRADEIKAGGQAINDLTAVQEAERAAIYRKFEDAAIGRLQSISDRLFATINDPTTLSGQLAAFDRTAQRQREDEIKAGGENLVSLEITQMAERLRVIQEFNDKAVEADKQAAKERLDALNSAAKNIVDYLHGLLAGPESTLSPQARLAQAQATYNAQLALAQGGDVNAQAGITSVAEDLRKAARDFFGSGLGYQNIFNQIVQQLLALPAVQTTTDPVVVAVRDAITAIQGTTNAVGGTTGAVAAVYNAAVDTTSAVDDATTQITLQKAVLDIIDASTAAATTQIIQTNALQSSANALTASTNSFLDAMNSLLTAIRDLQITATNQLTSMNTLLSSFANFYAVSIPIYRALAWNTSHYVVDNNTSSSWNLFGLQTFKRGGLVTGPEVGRDSVRAMLTPGEVVIREPVASKNSWLQEFNRSGTLPGSNVIPFPAHFSGPSNANDNSALVAEVRALRDEVSKLREENTRATVASAEHVRAGVDGIVNAVKDDTRDRKLASR